MISDFYVLFNIISVISGRWADANERLCAMEPRLRLRRFHLERGSNSGSVGQRSTHWTTGVRLIYPNQKRDSKSWFQTHKHDPATLQTLCFNSLILWFRGCTWFVLKLERGYDLLVSESEYFWFAQIKRCNTPFILHHLGWLIHLLSQTEYDPPDSKSCFRFAQIKRRIRIMISNIDSDSGKSNAPQG